MAEAMPLLTVTQLTQAIKLSLEATFPLVSVQGEISNFKEQSSGHLYFSLKDAHAQVQAVMFRSSAKALARLPRNGDQVIVQGELNVYPPRGSYQIVVRGLQLAGIGELLLRLEELKAKLKQRGWFAPEHKKALPRFPKRIGVITSPTGAAIQDILHILSRRLAGFHLILNPVKVQGQAAAEEIACAIEQCNQYAIADVLIVGRGGGSIEDLFAFNEERVAEAIFHSRIPIISAVGHETDTTLADFVADVRAPTPSAAAEIVAAEKKQQLDQLHHWSKQLSQFIGHFLKYSQKRLDTCANHPLFCSSSALLGMWLQRFDDLRSQLDQNIEAYCDRWRLRLDGKQRLAESLNPKTKLRYLQERLAASERMLTGLIIQRLTAAKRSLDERYGMQRFENTFYRVHKMRCKRLAHLNAALQGTSPKRLLERGYSLLFSEKDSSIISSIHMLHPGAAVRIRLVDGQAHATINKTDPT